MTMILERRKQMRCPKYGAGKRDPSKQKKVPGVKTWRSEFAEAEAAGMCRTESQR